ncbi:MAG: DUF2905 domain-containing protein, partial [Balneolaceae bacterium]
MSSELGKWLILFGALLILAGLIVYFFGGKLGWIGNLPGDIRIERENFSFYFPVTTMILASIFFSLLLTLAFRLFRNGG